MSGHSHWATIKHKKAATDAKKGKAFSKVVKLIMAAAKKGGGDPKHNIKLMFALDKAKECNLPKDTIEKAIKKGTGELEGVTFEDVTYEGYGPGGCAIMVDALTDNMNRTVGEIRRIFEMRGGNMGVTGCVGFMFDKKGVIVIPANGMTEDQATELGLEVGAEDVQPVDDMFEITCGVTDFAAVVTAIKAKKIEPTSAGIMRLAKTRMDLPMDKCKGALGLIDMLEEHEDVQEIASNFNLPDGFIPS